MEVLLHDGGPVGRLTDRVDVLRHAQREDAGRPTSTHSSECRPMPLASIPPRGPRGQLEPRFPNQVPPGGPQAPRCPRLPQCNQGPSCGPMLPPAQNHGRSSAGAYGNPPHSFAPQGVEKTTRSPAIGGYPRQPSTEAPRALSVHTHLAPTATQEKYPPKWLPTRSVVHASTPKSIPGPSVQVAPTQSPSRNNSLGRLSDQAPPDQMSPNCTIGQNLSAVRAYPIREGE